jgi:hypothetical protein
VGEQRVPPVETMRTKMTSEPDCFGLFVCLFVWLLCGARDRSLYTGEGMGENLFVNL